jgi:WD40 repeat protein
VNFDGPVRVTEAAGPGSATITLSFDAWKGAPVASTTHSLAVLASKGGPKEEPVAPNLITSFIHPERKASIRTVTFSADGSRLFAAGYPSGTVQIWDVASRKEIRRIDTPPGLRVSANYAVLAPDWKTLYVPVDKRAVKAFERDGKKMYRIDYSGKIRAWDVASGRELDSLQPPVGTAPIAAMLGPDGRRLVSVERSSYDASGPEPNDVTVVWDLATAIRRKLCEGFSTVSFAPDGKTYICSQNDNKAQTSVMQVLELATGKELSKVGSPEKGRHFSIGQISSDGLVLTASLSSKDKGAPIEVWFLDARTLADRGKLVAQGDPGRYGLGPGRLTPDGKRYVLLDGVGNALVWNVAEKKLERTLPMGDGRQSWRLAVSPDSETLAVAWAPKGDADIENAQDPDPRDLPQPRVSLIDLSGKSPPRVFITPHGYNVGGLTFSPDSKTLAVGGAGAVHLFDVGK